MSKPLAIDLFCGLGGWTEGLLAEGYDVVGFDIEQHVYGDHKYPAQLVLQDVLTVHGKQFKSAALIVASPPCQEYSYMAMPWSLAKEKQRRIEADPEEQKRLTALFDACFRIQREAIEAAGHFIPLVVENVKGAQRWVGRSRWNYGSFHLWGDVPALMPITKKCVKVGGIDFNGYGTPGYKAIAFNGTAEKRLREEIKNNGGSWFNIGSPGQKETGRNPVHELTGTKFHASGPAWFDSKTVDSIFGHCGPASYWSGSDKRKAASAMIAKIPLELARHIARTYHP